jgi:chromatin remodeling complex protein RSC6
MTKRKTTRRKSKRKTTRRKSKRKTTRRKSKRKTTRRKSRSKKKVPFGGYAINFTNCHDTLEEVFGKKPVTPPQMTKLIWKYIKKKRIASMR